VNGDTRKLTVYFGESDRVDGALLSDALLDVFERRGLHAAALLRGVEGFGAKHRLHTQRFLTLSEDLPLVAIGVGARDRIDGVFEQAKKLVHEGLVTLERAQIGGASPHEEAKLTLYVARDEPYVDVVDELRRGGVAGATVLLGVDGMAHGSRRRARFLSRNGGVPLLVVSVGSADSIERALANVRALLVDPVTTLERVRVCKRDGRLLARPQEHDGWQKLTVYAGEQARHEGRPLYIQLIRRLREAGAAGATAVRGVWGFSGDHAAHGDRPLRVRRRVPVVTTIVDRSEESVRWFEIVDELTDEAGLVTSEIVPTVIANPGGAASRSPGRVRAARRA
jgi:PII-like signaling protein